MSKILARMRILFFCFIISSFFITLQHSLCFAEVVYFKSGVKVLGAIKQKTDTTVTMDYHGEPLEFLMQDVDKITKEPETPTINSLLAPDSKLQIIDHTYILLEAIISSQEMADRISHFYQNPDNDFIIDTFEFSMANPNGILNDPPRWYPLVHFYSTVARGNDDLIKKLKILETEIREPYKKEISRIIYFADNLKPVPAVRDFFDLDFLWSEFYATGQSGPVEKIIDVLDYLNLDPALPSDQKEIACTYGIAAFESLVSNMFQHDKIVDIVRQQIQMRSGLCRIRLRMAMGRYYLGNRKYDEALTWFFGVLTDDIAIAQIHDIYLYMGQAYIGKGDKENALRQYDKLKMFSEILAEKLHKELQ